MKPFLDGQSYDCECLAKKHIPFIGQFQQNFYNPGNPSEGVKKLIQRKKWFLAQRGVGRLENFTA
jgi:hypothetical protein